MSCIRIPKINNLLVSNETEDFFECNSKKFLPTEFIIIKKKENNYDTNKLTY